jgi:hypothetical protein
MDEKDYLLLSIALNLALDGRPNLNNVSPAIAAFVRESITEYMDALDEPEEEEGAKQIYEYANSVLSKSITNLKLN